MDGSRSHAPERSLTSDPAAEAAQEAGLTYTSDGEPGISRIRRGKRFDYVGPDGRAIREEAVLDRIRSLAIPPAWEHVWISTRPRGHLQATGRDARGRKQHLYHPRWRETRDANKFDRMAGFAKVLPRIRRRVTRDLLREGLPKDKVVATIVRLLETTYARIGNEEYARQNRSFGLTTLRDRHVEVSVVKRCEELPGQHLFQYVDAEGERGTVTSDDVNTYLREVTGEDFTAKDYRTWAGTVLATCALRALTGFESDAEAKSRLIAAIDTVAHKLGHTRAVCRRSYVHPAVVDAYMDRVLDRLDGKSDEAAVLALLRRQSRKRVPQPRAA
ncbi:MAG: DNA topoisomerase IB [Chloroflexi bacterium]|nr:MAG: DNA topoisomerase IB [Chloroflexota bacterium]